MLVPEQQRVETAYWFYLKWGKKNERLCADLYRRRQRKNNGGPGTCPACCRSEPKNVYCLIYEIKEIKYYYQNKVAARDGIEK
jgi:hypothetical protein